MRSDAGKLTYAFGLLAPSLLLLACGPSEPLLYGDIEATYSLSFNQLRAYRLADELVLVYARRFDPADFSTALGKPIMNQPVRLTFRVGPQKWTLSQPTRFDSNRGGPSLGFVERYVIQNGPGGTLVQGEPFPTLLEGTVTFEALGEAVGEPVRGEFGCVFVNDRTLGGRFDVELSAP